MPSVLLRVAPECADRSLADGTIYRENLRNADATDVFILAGKGEETYTPHFTFHGFRYVEVTGYPGTPTVDSLSGEVLNSLGGEPAARLTTHEPDPVDLLRRLPALP